MENDGRFESGGNPTENVARRIGARSNGRIVRVYFSLPFRGMESEREELTQKQWPRLASICSKAGFEFVPVDLRCGITSEMFENAGTLDLSLREIDRSDIFVGFAGQQYSLHGEDKLLQKSFDSASTQYPWVNEYRNRSVTEIEFLHGHLRNPGDKPACFFFRDKEYDNKKVIEHETSESETEANNYKSVIDGQDSSSLLDDLKTRILESRDKCLKVVDSYSDPVDGAKRMFETVEKYLRETVLKTPAKDTTDHEKTSHLHNAYCNSRLGVGANKEYIGGDKYLEEVERHVLPDVEGYQNKPLLILGNPGSGKTSLLANWIHKHQKHYPEDIIAAHFVGCAPKSTSEQDVLIRLMTVLSLGFSEKSRLSKNDEMNNYYDSENSSTANNTYEKLRKMDIYKVVRELQDLLKKISESGMRAVIIIDALNKMESMHKTNQELYWLPTELPMGVSLLISSQNDTKSTKILLEDRQFDKLDVGPLDVEDRERIIKEILDVRGKRLEVEQTEKIINKPQTENPLFLKILLQDLCNFGSFEKLEEHLESLLSADSTKELFNNVLERMESSVDPSSTGRESILSKVMSCIAVSRYGLSEKEIKSIVNIPDHIWSRIYFTMEEFFIDRVGILAFAYDELLATVYDRYCDDEGTRVLYTRMVSSYFQGSLDGVGDTFNKDIKVVYRIVDELPWLLNKLKDNEQMKKCLTHLGLFMSMFSDTDGKYDLYEYWNYLDSKGNEISDLYMKSVDKQVANMYTEWFEKYNEVKSPAKELLAVVYAIGELIYNSGHPRECIPVLKRVLRLQKYAYTEEELLVDTNAATLNYNTLNKLAISYSDTENFDESERIFHKCLAINKKFGDRFDDSGAIMNDLAVLYERQGKHDDAKKLYEKVLEIRRATLDENHILIGDSLNNIGTLLFHTTRFEEAIEYLNQAIEVYEVYYFGRFHPDVAEALSNLASCYMNLKQCDKAGKIYERVHDLTVKALGDQHPDVAEKLMNWGMFCQSQRNYLSALDMYERALQIFKTVFNDEHMRVLCVMENIAFAYALLGRHDDAHPYFSEAGEILQRTGRIDSSLPDLNNAMLNYYIDSRRYDDIRILLERTLDAKFAKAEHFIMLDKLDNMVVDDERPKRRYEHTLDYALTRFPNDEELLEYIEEKK